MENTGGKDKSKKNIAFPSNSRFLSRVSLQTDLLNDGRQNSNGQKYDGTDESDQIDAKSSFKELA